MQLLKGIKTVANINQRITPPTVNKNRKNSCLQKNHGNFTRPWAYDGSINALRAAEKHNDM